MTDLWITASKASSAFVPAHEFLLQDGAAERKYGFTLATAYDRAQQRPLLSGMNVYFTPGNCYCQQLFSLLRCGSLVLTRP